ncbi:MAG: dihydroorotate dehydrogenase (quinone), partial [Microbacteriaceae bacterium]|nr:dihydroorotate dehydrogenase (quinone) [Microbacteriaceae bacterium]
MYRLLFALVLSRLDPENAHHLAMRVIRVLPIIGVGFLVRGFTAPHKSLAVQALGLTFAS